MFLRLLTFYQVMSAFLQFVYPFGQTEDSQDTHFSGFRGIVSLNPTARKTTLEQMGRSGLGCQQCYNLKSVEPYPGRKQYPWAIRPTAVYHSFDTLNGKSTWITVKGSELIRDRVNETLRDQARLGRKPNGLAQAFSTSLIVHTILADWAGEHWRWYINFLDQMFHETSYSVLSMNVDQSSAEPRFGRSLTRRSTAYELVAEIDQNSDAPHASCVQAFYWLFGITKKPTANQESEGGQNVNMATRTSGNSDKKTLGFKQIQMMGNIEEKVSEAKRVLVCNIDTLTALRDHYQCIWDDPNLPVAYRDQCSSDYADFQGHLKLVIDDMRRHTLNLENVLALVDVRKNVVSEEPSSAIRRQADH